MTDFAESSAKSLQTTDTPDFTGLPAGDDPLHPKDLQMPKAILKHRLADGSIRVRVTNSDYRFVITGRRDLSSPLTVLSWSKVDLLARKAASNWRSKGAVEVRVEPLNHGK